MKKIWLIFVAVAVIIVGVAFVLRFVLGGSEDSWICQNNQWVRHGNPSASQPLSGCGSSTQEKSWQEQDVAISGKFADADVVDLGNGKYRMYYSTEPEVEGNSLEIYSATTTDGITWTEEEGIRKIMATFPDIIKLPDGPSTNSGQASWRMYFQNQMVIKSAKSTDGITWTDETGVRIDKTEEGFDLESVGAQSTIILSDNTYLMVYRGTENKPYGTEKLPNQNTQLFFYATSPDGINFTKKGVALDSRNSTLKGLTDGADLIKWDNNEIMLYFWSYKGIYHVIYENGKFTSLPIFDFTNKSNSNEQYPQNPPGDPSVIKITDKWYMFYGQHSKGIYYANYQ